MADLNDATEQQRIEPRPYGNLQTQCRALGHHVLRYGMGRKKLVSRVPWLDAKLLAYSRDVHGRKLFKTAMHEPGVTAALLRYLRLAPQDVILDIGANIGYYCVMFDRATDAKVAVHAFEAEPRNFELLQHNLRANGADKVTTHRVALSDSVGEAELFVYKDSNLGKHSLIPLDGTTKLTVPTATVDGIWRERGLGDRRPSLIKIDIEGGEHRALSAARAVLARCPMVMSEFSQKFMRRAGIDPQAHLDLMTGLGFAPLEIERSGALVPLDPAALPGLDHSANIAWASESARASAWWPAFVHGD